VIESLSNKRVKDWCRLKLKKYRDSSFLLKDKGLLCLSKEKGLLQELIYCDELPFEFHNAYRVSKEVMYKIAEEDMAYIGVCKRLEKKEIAGDKILILDRLQDPLNVGTLCFNAFKFGFKTIILAKGSADIYHEKCLEAAKESLFELNIFYADLNEEISKLKAEGYQICATGLNDYSIFLDELEIPDKCALIMGNEGSGVSEELFKLSDQIIKIRMDNIDSLNVAMAGGILMHYLTNK